MEFRQIREDGEAVEDGVRGGQGIIEGTSGNPQWSGKACVRVAKGLFSPLMSRASDGYRVGSDRENDERETLEAASGMRRGRDEERAGARQERDG